MPVTIQKISLKKYAVNEFISWVDSLPKNLDLYQPSLHTVSNSAKKTSYYRKSAKVIQDLFPEFCTLLKNISLNGREPMLIVIKNAPLDPEIQNIPTPQDFKQGKEKGSVSELMIMGISHLLNSYIRVQRNEVEPFCYPFHQVTPHKGKEKKEGVNYGAGDFPFHQDRIFCKQPIDYHLLYGIRRGKQKTPTHYLALSDLLTGMPRKLFLNLFQKEFASPKTGGKINLLHGRSENRLWKLTSNLDVIPGWIQPLTERARNSLEWLYQNSKTKKLKQNAKKIIIGPGVIVLSDHKRTLHGRKPFSPGKSTQRRWMQRAYLCKR